MADSTIHLPPGWLGGSSRAEDYELRLDNRISHSGQASAHLRSIVEAPQDFVTLTQGFLADDYLDRRLRLTAYIKAEKVEGWAGMWMRVDPREGKARQFDNMQSRPIRGNSDWQQYQVVLDVPRESLYVYFGVLLHGRGSVWADDFQLEVVGRDVPTTGAPPLPPQPRNLGFEE
ncbi:MAG: hypothetical protein ACR2JY_07960 [Chloroflexota bacterium]